MTLDLRPTLDRLGVSLRDLARGSAMSLGAAHNLAAAGELPRRSADAVRHRVVAYLKTPWGHPADLGGLLLPRTQKIPRPICGSAGALPNPANHDQAKEDPMLLQNANLTEKARKHFGLPQPNCG